MTLTADQKRYLVVGAVALVLLWIFFRFAGANASQSQSSDTVTGVGGSAFPVLGGSSGSTGVAGILPVNEYNVSPINSFNIPAVSVPPIDFGPLAQLAASVIRQPIEQQIAQTQTPSAGNNSGSCCGGGGSGSFGSFIGFPNAPAPITLPSEMVTGSAPPISDYISYQNIGNYNPSVTTTHYDPNTGTVFNTTNSGGSGGWGIF